jgi:hypothetical protein
MVYVTFIYHRLIKDLDCDNLNYKVEVDTTQL